METFRNSIENAVFTVVISIILLEVVVLIALHAFSTVLSYYKKKFGVYDNK